MVEDGFLSEAFSSHSARGHNDLMLESPTDALRRVSAEVVSVRVAVVVVFGVVLEVFAMNAAVARIGLERSWSWRRRCAAGLW